MTEITRHFTATTFIVDGARVLLHLHPKQQLWLPPGGHLERDELPHDAALREVEEETGLRVALHSAGEAAATTKEMRCLVVPQPAFILVEDINPYHQHIDFTYFARLPLEARTGRSWVDRGFDWFESNDLFRAGVPENVRAGARRAVTHFGGDLEGH